jgi:enoyl-CoA hydratase
MGTRVAYELLDSVATITMDDGKVNALAPEMLAEVGGALDRADAEAAAVVLTGRPDRFSGGFDLGVLRSGGAAAADLVIGGFRLAERLLSYRLPVVIACTGHAIAMASFLLLSGDYRIGVSGSYRITANEVAIGMSMPRAAVELCRQRLTPAHFNRAVILAEVYDPDGAVVAGFLDRVVAPAQLAEVAHTVAVGLTDLDGPAHAFAKTRARAGALEALAAAIDADDADLRASL